MYETPYSRQKEVGGKFVRVCKCGRYNREHEYEVGCAQRKQDLKSAAGAGSQGCRDQLQREFGE